ncbi:quinone oxidoreductase-like protein 1 isoform X2 [Echeneis naucrates]|uniref:quinone oxidoreductase-like protein 1 isoform X2 n=1 Tax=Echeneis naucrates TaxID=173247 RepID=UPI0011146C70|nr:quinone oxidoreductase-like protein 1 isoform X2 [Echeneis naucrates]
MKGLYCRADAADAQPKFVIQETSLPEVLGSHQVRVQVKACGLSPLDFKLLGDIGIQRDLIPVGREVAGVVQQVGPKVCFFQPEDEVVGILPLDASCSGLCDVIDIDEHYLVQKPEKLSSVCVAAALRDALCAYTALHTHARMAVGHTLLVMDGASVRKITKPLDIFVTLKCKDMSKPLFHYTVDSFLVPVHLIHVLMLPGFQCACISSSPQSFGLMCIQLASYHGVRVLTTSHSLQKHTFLEQLRPSVARVIQVYNGSSDLLPIVLEETGGLGVDIIIDSGVRLQEEEELKETKCLPHKHELISALGVGGHWVTSHQDLQLDPPDCRLLHLKSASVSFLNPETWTASSAQQGRYLHILKDILEKMAAGVLRPQPEDAVSLYEATVAMETVQHNQRKKAVVQL